MSTTETENLPATKHEDHPELVMRPLAALDLTNPNATGYVTNVGRGGRDLAVFMTNAMAAASRTLDDLCIKPILAKYYIARVIEFISEGGEIVPLPWLLLVSPSGDTASFTSEGAIKSLDMIRQLVGDGPWEPPLSLSAVPVKTRLGRRTYRLVLGANTDANQEADVRGDLRRSFGADQNAEPQHDAASSGGRKKRPAVGDMV